MPCFSAHHAALGVARIGAAELLRQRDIDRDLAYAAPEIRAWKRAQLQRQVVGQLPPTLHEVQQEQVTVREKANQITAAINACNNPALLSQWTPLRDRAAAYATQEFGPWGYLGFLFVTPDDLENGKQLERDMAPWFKIAADCGGKLPSPAPLPSGSGSGFDFIPKTLEGASQLLLLWLAYELLVKRGS